jgi:hypothetical protein
VTVENPIDYLPKWKGYRKFLASPNHSFMEVLTMQNLNELFAAIRSLPRLTDAQVAAVSLRSVRAESAKSGHPLFRRPTLAISPVVRTGRKSAHYAV